MSFIDRIIEDLRNKPLVAVGAGVLLAALIAVPLLLSKSSNASTPIAQSPTLSQAPQAGVPVVSSNSSPTSSKLTGSSRNPFVQLASSATSAVSSALGTKSSTSGTSGTSTTPASTTPSTSTGTSTSTGSTTTPTTTIPTGTPKPAPAGLTATQSYDVKLAITNSSGDLNTIDPLERLSVLPSNRKPLMVELGVLKGGNDVLFALQPGTVVSGPGTCIPGPVDCEILALGQDQTESLGTHSGSVALFAVTGISAGDHPSVAAADAARRKSSAAGRALLSGSTSTALALFSYEPSLGVLVDLRNLTVGG